MQAPSIEKIYDLLETRQIAGNAEQLQKLCVRIGELVEAKEENGLAGRA